jgi:citrate synthase
MKTKPWESQITRVEKNKLITRGVNQTEIIETYSFEEMFYLTVLGTKPSALHAKLLRAVILSHCSHGISGQSMLAVRMAADCGAPFLSSALAGFLVGFGQYHLGSLDLAMEMLIEASVCSSLEDYLTDRLNHKKLIYGYGHRIHTYDPRAETLMRLCEQNQFQGCHIAIAREMDRIMGIKHNKRMNIEAACAAILLDLGFPKEVGSAVIIAGRTAMCAAVYIERLRTTPKKFPLLEVADILPGS